MSSRTEIRSKYNKQIFTLLITKEHTNVLFKNKCKYSATEKLLNLKKVISSLDEQHVKNHLLDTKSGNEGS